jgi:hypothetical protein
MMLRKDQKTRQTDTGGGQAKAPALWAQGGTFEYMVENQRSV